MAVSIVQPERHGRAAAEESQPKVTLPVRYRDAEETRDFATYSIQQGEILETVIETEVDVGYRYFRGAGLSLGDHPIADGLRELRMWDRPAEVRYFSKIRSILPAPRARFPL